MQGILIINKPKGYTSQDVVSKVKKILNIKKAGHTGTLDPLATGVLPVMLGNYTKLSKYLIEHDKTYIARVKLGLKSSTGDLEGNVIQKEDFNKEILNTDYIIEKLNTFKGKSSQIPPIYSSIKVDGKKLYEYAREGKSVEIKPREIEIYDIVFREIIDDEIEFEVSCSKGTYIRVLCEDIAKSLGTIGLMSFLQRTKVDNFEIKNAIELDKLTIDIAQSNLVEMSDIFKNLDVINLDNRKKELFLNGVMLTFTKNNGLYNIYSNNKYLGTGIVKNNLLKRDVIIND